MHVQQDRTLWKDSNWKRLRELSEASFSSTDSKSLYLDRGVAGHRVGWSRVEWLGDGLS